MSIITAQQSRDVRRELSLSQADISKTLGFNRQYFSEFETSFSTRLTSSQLKKLRAYYEEKIAEANANGEAISITFGVDDKPSPVSNPPLVSPVKEAPWRFLPIYLDVDQPIVIKTQGVIQDNDARIAVILQQAAERDAGFFGDDDFTEECQELLQEAFSLMAANYALWRSLGGWPALGLSPSTEDPQTIRDVVFSAFGEQFKQAGLFVEPSTDADLESGEEVAA